MKRRACRDCGSPAMGRPCWDQLREKVHNPNYDPPCLGWEHYEERRESRKKMLDKLVAFALATLLLVFGASVVYHVARNMFQ